MINFMKLFFSALFLPFFVTIHAQQDPKAGAILDEFSKKSKSYTSMKIDFQITVDDKQTKSKEIISGNMLLKGPKYLIKTDQAHIYCDSKNNWSYLPEVNEVSISKVDPNATSEDLFLSNPGNIFNVLKKDYKYRYLEQKTISGRSCHIIDLFPNDLQTSYSRIRLIIDAQNYQPVTAVTFGKSGIIYEMKVLKFTANAVIVDTSFTFDAKKHPGVQVVDLR